MNIKPNESFLITSQPNIYYFSKISDPFRGVFLLFTKNKRFVLTDTRFIKEAAKIAAGFTPIIINKDDHTWWQELLKKQRIKTVYFEPHDISYARLNKFRTLSRGLAQLRPSAIDLRILRSQKTPAELASIRQAVRLTEQILAEVVKLFRQPANYGRLSEQDVSLEIQRLGLAVGCTELAFQPIVAFGSATGIPHHQPRSGRRLQGGDMILIDMGLKYKHYCADITRTFFTQTPSIRQVAVYNQVLRAQQATIKNIKTGVTGEQLYERVCTDFGLAAAHFTHGLGHGVGLEIHEHPALKFKKPDQLRSGQVVTVEPGLYYSWGGVRIEDMVVVRNSGCQILTKFPKELSQVTF